MRQVKLEFEAALPENIPCHFIFKWTSYQVCPSFAKEHQTEPLEKLPTNTKKTTRSKTGLVLIVLLFSVSVFGAFYLRLPENRERLHENLRRVRNQMCQRNQDEQEHTLLFQSNVNIPTFGDQINRFGDLDDDEDLIIA